MEGPDSDEDNGKTKTV
jgi:hypothetical protein